MDFNTPYSRKERQPEYNDGKQIVETAGVLTAQQQINNLLRAGQNLLDYRRSQFDTYAPQPDAENIALDPTREPNFDLADASETLEELEAKAAAAEAPESEPTPVPEPPAEPEQPEDEGKPF